MAAAPASLAWAGLANTYFGSIPKQKVTGVILTQILPFADQKALKLLSISKPPSTRTAAGGPRARFLRHR